MTDPIADLLAEVPRAHRLTTGMSVTMGATCACGYWTGNEVPGKTRPVGHQGLEWHLAVEQADAIRAFLTSDAMRERVADALINQGYEPYTYALDAAGRILAAITEGDQP